MVKMVINTTNTQQQYLATTISTPTTNPNKKQLVRNLETKTPTPTIQLHNYLHNNSNNQDLQQTAIQ